MTASLRIEYVEWVDSNGMGRWFTVAEIVAQLPLAVCTTVGFVVHETGDGLWLALSHDHQQGDELHYDHVTVIPKVAITKREVLHPAVPTDTTGDE